MLRHHHLYHFCIVYKLILVYSACHLLNLLRLEPICSICGQLPRPHDYLWHCFFFVCICMNISQSFILIMSGADWQERWKNEFRITCGNYVGSLWVCSTRSSTYIVMYINTSQYIYSQCLFAFGFLPFFFWGSYACLMMFYWNFDEQRKTACSSYAVLFLFLIFNQKPYLFAKR